jgi:transcriptional regulator with XRE-family HTH domain
MTVKDDFRKRLRAAMKAAGMRVSGTELERAFALEWHGRPISVQTAANWINGKYLPSQDKLPVLARVLKVDPHALLYGASESLSAAEQRREWEDRVNYAERQAIDAFLRLPTPQRLIVRDVINAFAKAYGAVDPGKE